MAQMTLIQAEDALVNSYMAWFREGILNGNWIQKGVFNFRGVAGIGKTSVFINAGKRCAEAIKADDKLMKELRKQYGNDYEPNTSMFQLPLTTSLDPEAVAGSAVPGKINVTNYKGDTEEVPTLIMNYRAEIIQAKALGPGATMLVDEWGTEGRHMRPFCLKLMSWEKNLAGLDVSDMYLLACSNPADEDHQVDDNSVDARFSSRIIDIDIEPDIDEWVDWMYRLTPTHRTVAAFVKDNHGLFIGREQKGQNKGEFLCPRSWDSVAHNLHIHGNGTCDTQDKEGIIPGKHGKMELPEAFAVVAGIVGAKPANDLKVYMTEDRPMTVSQVLNGQAQPNAAGRFNSVPPSLMKGLHFHLKKKDLTDDQADNLAIFLKGISGDAAASVVRDAVNIRPRNKVHITKRKMQSNFMDRVRQDGR